MTALTGVIIYDTVYLLIGMTKSTSVDRALRTSKLVLVLVVEISVFI